MLQNNLNTLKKVVYFYKMTWLFRMKGLVGDIIHITGCLLQNSAATGHIEETQCCQLEMTDLFPLRKGNRVLLFFLEDIEFQV